VIFEFSLFYGAVVEAKTHHAIRERDPSPPIKIL
jgi:hypothetical protein